MREEVLGQIHTGHFGINKCRERASFSVWWPRISNDITQLVKNCTICEERQPTQRQEPLHTTTLPDRPFQHVAADLCEHKGQNYLVLIDYYSRYLEIFHLPRITALVVIGKMMNVFAHHGIPEVLVTDNGRQFISSEFKEFAKKWQFRHVTSSPYFPQSNGEAERAVREAKKILSQKDPFLALLAYRATPTTPTGVSPAQLLMGRCLRTTLPTLEETRQPCLADRESVRQCDAKSKTRNKLYYDRRHGVFPLPELRPGEVVLQKLPHDKEWNTPATVVRKCNPRSYIVENQFGSYRRNRWHLRPSSRCLQPRNLYPDLTANRHSASRSSQDDDAHLEPDIAPARASITDTTQSQPEPAQSPEVQEQPLCRPSAKYTRSGRLVKPPARYIEEN